MKIIKPLTVFLMLTLAVSSGHAQEPERKWKIGLIGPLTGPVAEAGESLRNCAIMALEKFGLTEKVTLISEDDGFQPRNSVAAFSKLTRQDKVDAVIIFGSTTSLSVVDLAQAAQVPTFTIAITDKVLGRKGVYRIFAELPKLAEKIIEGIKERQYKSIALVATQHDATLGIRDGIQRDLKGTKIVLSEELDPQDRDFKTLAAKIRQLNPDAVGLFLLPPQHPIFASQLRALGYSGELFAGPPIQGPSELSAGGALFEGVWLAGSDDLKFGDFYTSYSKRFNSSLNIDGCYSYELMAPIVAGLESGDLVQYLKDNPKFDSRYGELEVNSSGSISTPIVLKVIKAGWVAPFEAGVAG